MAPRLLDIERMRSPLPIAVFFSSFEPGAATRALVDVVTRIDRSRFDVSVGCIERRGRWLSRVEAAGLPVSEFPVLGFHHGSAVTEARRFARWCRERALAVVHATGFRGEVFALPAAAFAGVPMRVATRVELAPDSKAVRAALRRAAYACARAIVVPSRAIGSQLEAEHVPAHRVRVIPQGIDVASFGGERAERPVRRVAVHVVPGAADGLAEAFRALALVAGRCRELEVILDGRTTSRERVLDLAVEHGIGDRLRLHPWGTPSRLASADLFVAPSGLGPDTRPALEAMAAGLPVVTCRGEEAAGVVQHQRTGVLVPPHDARALAFALLDLVQWPAHARGLGVAARACVERHHRLDAMVAAFERLYEDDAAASRAPIDERREVVAS
jgi:glycosyltransferase involved in cell wall biosynthesis